MLVETGVAVVAVHMEEFPQTPLLIRMKSLVRPRPESVCPDETAKEDLMTSAPLLFVSLSAVLSCNCFFGR